MQDYNNEFEYEEEYEMDEMEMEYEDEFEFEYDDEMEMESEYDDEFEYDDEEDSELAYELLDAQNEEELDQFLGGLFKKAVSWGAKKLIPRLGRSVMRRAAPKALRRPFMSAAKRFGRRMLPQLGRAAGRYAGNRWGGKRGGHYGGRTGQNLGRFFVDKWGWELEGMGPEEQEFHAAKKLVKIVKNAAKKAIKTAATKKAPPKAIIKAALNAAAKGQLGGGRKKPYGSRYSGRWIRKGNKIIVQGA